MLNLVGEFPSFLSFSRKNELAACVEAESLGCTVGSRRGETPVCNDLIGYMVMPSRSVPRVTLGI